MASARGSLLTLLLVAGLLPTAAAAQQIRAVATIKPVHALLAAVMAGAGEPTLLIDGAGSPHTYALKPSDAKALNGADLIVRVADTIEPFMGKILASLPARVEVVSLVAVPGLTLLATRAGGAFEAHAHAKGAGHGHGGGKGTATAIDGHIWLDPDNARLIVAHLAAVLGRLAPGQAALFRDNAARATAEIEALAAEVGQTLAPVKARAFVVFHDAYQYLEARFGMPAAGSVTVSPDVQPSAKRLSELRARIGKLGAVCVFSEPQFEPRLVATVTEGTGARAGVLDPLGADIAPGPGLYPTLMRRLAASLAGCLARTS